MVTWMTRGRDEGRVICMPPLQRTGSFASRYIEITEQDANMGVTDRTYPYIDASKVQKYRIKNR